MNCFDVALNGWNCTALCAIQCCTSCAFLTKIEGEIGRVVCMTARCLSLVGNFEKFVAGF
jgi:hypothetical protein